MIAEVSSLKGTSCFASPIKMKKEKIAFSESEAQFKYWNALMTAPEYD